MNISPEKMILIASSISLEIVKDKSLEEINSIRNLLNLICSNLQSYTQQKIFFDNQKTKM